MLIIGNQDEIMRKCDSGNPDVISFNRSALVLQLREGASMLRCDLGSDKQDFCNFSDNLIMQNLQLLFAFLTGIQLNTDQQLRLCNRRHVDIRLFGEGLDVCKDSRMLTLQVTPSD